MLVRMLWPERPALRNVSMLPAEAIHMGGRGRIGLGSTLTSISSPAPFLTLIFSPAHRRSTVSMDSCITSRRRSKFSGFRTKSLTCQPLANERPTRPCEMLSTTAHSSATRIGSCRGITTLPARSSTLLVIDAIAADVTAGLG